MAVARLLLAPSYKDPNSHARDDNCDDNADNSFNMTMIMIIAMTVAMAILTTIVKVARQFPSLTSVGIL